MRCLVISNPNSTSLTPSLMNALIAPLREAADLHAVFTTRPRHATELVRGLTRQDFDAIIAIGGDGTVNEILQGLLGSDTTKTPHPEEVPVIGVIPTGSANVFARALGFPNHPVEAAELLSAMMTQRAYRRVSVGTINSRWFCVNVGFGLDAEVINRMEKIRSLGISASPFHYLLVAIRTWLHVRGNTPRIHFAAGLATGEVASGDVPLVLVSNTNPWTYAGPIPVVTNPEHSIDGGGALYALNNLRGPVGFFALANALGIPLRPLSPHRVDFRETRVDGITSLTLTTRSPLKWQLDGEFGGEDTRLDISWIPNAIDVLGPKPPSNV